MPTPAALLSSIGPIFCCPACKKSLATWSDCAFCKASFSSLNQIPLLFPNASQHRRRYAFSLLHLTAKLDAQIDELQNSSQVFPIESSRERISQYRKALIARKNLFLKVLGELQNEASGTGQAPIDGLFDFNQYYPNILRDWSENFSPIELQTQLTKCFELIDAAVNNTHQELSCWIPGSGPSRLAFELAHRYPKIKFIAFDLNPFLLGVAKKICDGEELQAPEFPIAPLSSKNSVSSHKLHSVRPTPENLFFVLGDYFNVPFTQNSFDLVITPWFIDVLHRSFFEAVQPIADTLKKGGHWINFGSFHFEKSKIPLQFAPDEFQELAEILNWKLIHRESYPSPYLNSTLSSHQRTETLHSFIFQKTNDFDIQKIHGDLQNPSLTFKDDDVLPLNQNLAQQKELATAEAKLLSYFDGKRSLSEIAQFLASDMKISHPDALHVVKRFVTRKFPR